MRARLTPIMLGVALTLAPISYANAQLGGLVKKAAKKAAAGKVEEKVVQQAVTKVELKPETYGEPFTDETLRMVLRGIEASVSVSARRNALDEQRQQASRKADDLEHSGNHPAETDRFTEATRKYEQCVNDAMEKSREANNERYNALVQQAATDPASREKMMKYMEQVRVAQSKGDTAGMRRAMEAMGKDLGLTPVADSSAAKKTCGAAPGEPAWMAEVRVHRARADTLVAQMRTVEQEMQGIGAKASGLEAQRFARQRERLQLWYRQSADSRKATFRDDERALLDAHKADIERAKSAL